MNHRIAVSLLLQLSLLFNSHPTLAKDGSFYCFENGDSTHPPYPAPVSRDCYIAGHHLLSLAAPRADSTQPFPVGVAKRPLLFHRHDVPLSAAVLSAIMNDPTPPAPFGVRYGWSYDSCTILVDMKSPRDTQLGSLFDVAMFALQMIQQCVDEDSRLGGKGVAGTKMLIAVAGVPESRRTKRLEEGRLS